MHHITFLFLLSGLLLNGLNAQLSPSNVYVFNWKLSSEGKFELSQPRYLTAFNAKGYNNQPFFINSNELYMAVQPAGQGQPDLYAFTLDRRVKTRITRTDEGEYSPRMMPDGRHFSAVRQEAVGRDTFLRLWQFPLDRLTDGQPVFKNLMGMGYYCWLDSRHVALFKLGSPNELVIAQLGSEREQKIAENIGRCLQLMPDGSLAFVQQELAGNVVMTYHPRQAGAMPKFLVECLEGSEDFAVLPDGSLLCGQGGKLFRFDPAVHTNWQEVADLRPYQIRNLSRLAVTADKIAVVNE